MSGRADSPVVVLASRVRTEEKRIMTALDRRGVPWTHVDTRALSHDTGVPATPWRVVLNREIGYHRAAHAALTLEEAGTRVLNPAAATRLCGDKWRTTLALRAAGVPTPRAVLALSPQAALPALAGLGYPAVVKPLVGSWGRLVTLLPDAATAAAVLEYVAALPGPQSHLVYAQQFVTGPGRDIRALVLGGRVLGASHRLGAGWRANVALGARSEPCEVTAELGALALAAAAAVGAVLAGVDLVEDGAGGLHVLEVNDRVEFAGLQAALGDRVDVAAEIVDFLVAEGE
ncbi:RimK family alpha-L-glutamate ligase [Actinosynnema sp. NPDC047251]|uniref:Carbamoyl-phosphate synthase L chain n=1 Tax=Saccharothrix espanaensis (strain ATCC 51144 / DSM 44229 / JCM 9112 / NBRC 15066 / NRRL 15764) TaxID=1179773 RepID=K0JYA4_SACES|nr:RimK family alpha-L-glutamate ligase [Saccharothrix espanaensis]CCH32930.1 Carbamoyl-phosphate synthase L chain [Saccharothrix espanaensis DSM 44229]